MNASNGFQLGNDDRVPTSSPNSQMSRGEQWLGSLTASVTSQGPSSLPPRRPPAFSSHGRSHSLGSPPEMPLFPSNSQVGAPMQSTLPAIPPRSSPFHATSTPPTTGNTPHVMRTNPLDRDPFDAEWASLATRNPNNTNPFLQSSVVKTFEVHM